MNKNNNHEGYYLKKQITLLLEHPLTVSKLLACLRERGLRVLELRDDGEVIALVENKEPNTLP